MRRRTFALAGTLVLTAVLAGCGQDEGGSGSASTGSGSGAIRIGTEGTYSPFSFHDTATNELTGYDVEVARAVGQELGREVEFSETTWDSIFAGLEAERFDVVGNQVSITPEREAKYTFSAPYTVSTGAIVTRADDTSVTSLADVAGKTSAQSTTSNWAATATGAGARVEAVEGLTQAVALLKQGRVDVTINDDLAILDYLKTSGDTSIKIAARTPDRTEQAFAFRKEDTALAAEFDTALAKLRADGTLAEISQKWFGEDVSGPAAG
ncbi:transporter substrate-binding domain-containing protein [Kineococcus glutinatus]|uniref:Solute-binding protein family 3/N-terminal domain-containing protein n=1 Tax=Kineococcus glutinatus TaxID=1070872 RepID=A0ABP9I4J0_9ACTN